MSKATEMSFPWRNTSAMLADMRAVRPEATLDDLERVLKAGYKRFRKGKGKRSAEARFIKKAIAEVHGERAMIQARRAALPRLRPWYGRLENAGVAG